VMLAWSVIYWGRSIPIWPENSVLIRDTITKAIYTRLKSVRREERGQKAPYLLSIKI